MNKEIEDIKRRAGILKEDVVPFRRSEEPQAEPEPAKPEVDLVAAKEKRVQAMTALSEALAEELWEFRHDKDKVKNVLRGVVDNMVRSVLFRFSDEG